VHQARLAALAAQQLAGAVGQHLVDVHIGLRARAGLPHHQRELARVLAGQHLIGGGVDGLGLLGIQQTQRMVDVADAFLTCASAAMISRGCCSPLMSKFCSERCVCAPQSLSAGTSMGPKVSFSWRVAGRRWKCLSFWDSLKANKAAQLAGGDLATVGRKTHWHAHACQQSRTAMQWQ
jgi:hypothetical protein